MLNKNLLEKLNQLKELLNQLQGKDIIVWIENGIEMILDHVSIICLNNIIHIGSDNGSLDLKISDVMIDERLTDYDDIDLFCNSNLGQVYINCMV